jgi:hypothetical protein
MVMETLIAQMLELHILVFLLVLLLDMIFIMMPHKTILRLLVVKGLPQFTAVIQLHKEKQHG